MVDWSKPIQTVRGRPVRVLCTDIKGRGQYSIAVAITEFDGGEYIATRCPSGSYNNYASHSSDIINVPKKPLTFMEWCDSYGGGPGSYIHETAEDYANYRVQFEKENHS